MRSRDVRGGDVHLSGQAVVLDDSTANSVVLADNNEVLGVMYGRAELRLEKKATVSVAKTAVGVYVGNGAVLVSGSGANDMPKARDQPAFRWRCLRRRMRPQPAIRLTACNATMGQYNKQRFSGFARSTLSAISSESELANTTPSDPLTVP